MEGSYTLLLLLQLHYKGESGKRAKKQAEKTKLVCYLLCILSLDFLYSETKPAFGHQ